jgi:hypothetical protein
MRASSSSSSPSLAPPSPPCSTSTAIFSSAPSPSFFDPSSIGVLLDDDGFSSSWPICSHQRRLEDGALPPVAGAGVMGVVVMGVLLKSKSSSRGLGSSRFVPPAEGAWRDVKGVLLTSMPSPEVDDDEEEVVVAATSPSRQRSTWDVISVGGNDAWQIGHSMSFSLCSPTTLSSFSLRVIGQRLFHVPKPTKKKKTIPRKPKFTKLITVTAVAGGALCNSLKTPQRTYFLCSFFVVAFFLVCSLFRLLKLLFSTCGVGPKIS